MCAARSRNVVVNPRGHEIVGRRPLHAVVAAPARCPCDLPNPQRGNDLTSWRNATGQERCPTGPRSISASSSVGFARPTRPKRRKRMQNEVAGRSGSASSRSCPQQRPRARAAAAARSRERGQCRSIDGHRRPSLRILNFCTANRGTRATMRTRRPCTRRTKDGVVARRRPWKRLAPGPKHASVYRENR